MEGMGVVGIDVSKARLDVAFRPSGKRLGVANGARGISRLVTALKAAVPECALLDRLTHHSHILTTRGDSYRSQRGRPNREPTAADGHPQSPSNDQQDDRSAAAGGGEKEN